MDKEINPFKDQNILPADAITPPERFGSGITSSKEMQIGFGSKVFRADESGIWLGASKWADAPFRVDMLGNVIANSITLGGYIPTGGALGDIGTGNITGTYIANDAITTPKILAGAITASKISVSSLSAISADIGTITAGTINGLTITGGTIQTSSSGLRTVLDGSTDTIRFMNSGTTYSSIEPYVYPQGSGLNIDAFGANIYAWAGTHAGVSMEVDPAYGSSTMGIYDNTAYISASSSIDLTGPTNIQGTNNHLTVAGNAFLRMKSMTGSTATGLSGVQDGAMYYRSDVGDVRVRVAGVWKTITVV